MRLVPALSEFSYDKKNKLMNRIKNHNAYSNRITANISQPSQKKIIRFSVHHLIWNILKNTRKKSEKVTVCTKKCKIKNNSTKNERYCVNF